MLVTCDCVFCNKPFEAKRSDAKCCTDIACKKAQKRMLYRKSLVSASSSTGTTSSSTVTTGRSSSSSVTQGVKRTYSRTAEIEVKQTLQEEQEGAATVTKEVVVHHGDTNTTTTTRTIESESKTARRSTTLSVTAREVQTIAFETNREVRQQITSWSKQETTNDGTPISYQRYSKTSREYLEKGEGYWRCKKDASGKFLCDIAEGATTCGCPREPYPIELMNLDDSLNEQINRCIYSKVNLLPSPPKGYALYTKEANTFLRELENDDANGPFLSAIFRAMVEKTSKYAVLHKVFKHRDTWFCSRATMKVTKKGDDVSYDIALGSDDEVTEYLPGFNRTGIHKKCKEYGISDKSVEAMIRGTVYAPAHFPSFERNFDWQTLDNTMKPVMQFYKEWRETGTPPVGWLLKNFFQLVVQGKCYMAGNREQSKQDKLQKEIAGLYSQFAISKIIHSSKMPPAMKILTHEMHRYSRNGRGFYMAVCDVTVVADDGTYVDITVTLDKETVRVFYGSKPWDELVEGSVTIPLKKYEINLTKQLSNHGVQALAYNADASPALRNVIQTATPSYEGDLQVPTHMRTTLDMLIDDRSTALDRLFGCSRNNNFKRHKAGGLYPSDYEAANVTEGQVRDREAVGSGYLGADEDLGSWSRGRFPKDLQHRKRPVETAVLSKEAVEAKERRAEQDRATEAMARKCQGLPPRSESAGWGPQSGCPFSL
jgi:hypothetical protein